MITGRGKPEVFEEEPVELPLCPPEIPQSIHWD
jgi:hypothetical protein